jgi:hypothetical protein
MESFLDFVQRHAVLLVGALGILAIAFGAWYLFKRNLPESSKGPHGSGGGSND